MARGWESKSVEAQMESVQNDGARSSQSESDGREKDREVERERQNLLLSRAYLLHRIESSSHERYTESLRQALNEIDQKLAHLKKG